MSLNEKEFSTPDASPQVEVVKSKCLIVDDLEENLKALEALLRSEDIEIVRASSGEAALELLLNHDFALALIDVQMPEMNGFELAELMRGMERTRSIPIIFVTAGLVGQQRVFQGYEAGAVDVLFKPLDPVIVRSKVRVFIELDCQKRLLDKRGQEQAALARELKNALKTRDDFFSIASHELKTPITSMGLQLQLLKRVTQSTPLDSPLRERFSKTMDSMSKQVKKLGSLVDDLLDVTRIQNGKLALQVEEMDLTALAEEVIERFTDSFQASGSPVELELEPELTGVWDRQRVEQVIVNLLSNACKYGAGSKIIIKSRRKDGFAQFSVEDFGMGISETKLPFIFDRFERAVTDSTIHGLGLGLYIAKQIVVAHQGTIRVNSMPGQGTIFVFELPLEG